MTKQIEKKRAKKKKKKQQHTVIYIYIYTGSVGRQIRLCISSFDNVRQASDSSDLCW